MKLVFSARNTFPRGAVWSSRKIAHYAVSAGYEAVEFLPTHSIVFEMLTQNKLSCEDALIHSAHRDWRYDRVVEAKVRNISRLRTLCKNKEDWLFPPSILCKKALQGMQDRYHIGVVSTWAEDTKNFLPAILELWSSKQGFTYEQLLNWLQKNPKQRGVVIDTAKFSGWLTNIGQEKNATHVLNTLIPFTKEVHYRLTKKDREAATGDGSLDWGILREDHALFQHIRSLGWDGPVVVEAGWPDLEKTYQNDIFSDSKSFANFHKTILQKIART